MSYRRYEIKLLHSKNNDVSIVTGGSNNCIQTQDVSWNKPFKVMARQKYDKWLAEEAIIQESIKRPVRIEAQFFWKISYKHKNSIKLDDNLNKREKDFSGQF